MKFEHIEDLRYFEKLLCASGENIDSYLILFDFRDPRIKRKEFNKNRNKILTKFIKEKGRICELGFRDLCNIEEGLCIDHLIPLSSNKLNKDLRKLKAESGKKVTTQSFGSNNEKNLLLVCKRCNSFKKHKFLSRGECRKILKDKIIS